MRVTSRLLSTAAVAAAMSLAVIGAGFAQEATPTTMDEAAGPDTFLSHIHTGTCDALGEEPVAQLAELTLPEWVGALVSGDEAAIESAAVSAQDFGNAPVPVAAATTEVPLPLVDIIAGKHAINVESADPNDPEGSVACGNIGGIVDENGDLFVGLEEMNNSGHNGIAWLHDNGTSTTIVVFVAHPEELQAIDASLLTLAAAATPEAAAAPAATPVAEADATPVT
jgi:hypothetical protein